MEADEQAVAIVKEEIAPQSTSLFTNTTPNGIIEEATNLANTLSKLINEKKLYKPIGKKKHVFVEGWTTLGALLGVFPYPVKSVRLDRGPDEITYEATVVVRTLNGVEISKGEAICSNKEYNWFGADEYAIKSMATTRATSKALRIPLGWIMVLSGFNSTPAEEMTDEMANNNFNNTPKQPPQPKGKPQIARTFKTPPQQNKDLNKGHELLDPEKNEAKAPPQTETPNISHESVDPVSSDAQVAVDAERKEINERLNEKDTEQSSLATPPQPKAAPKPKQPPAPKQPPTTPPQGPPQATQPEQPETPTLPPQSTTPPQQNYKPVPAPVDEGNLDIPAETKIAALVFESIPLGKVVASLERTQDPITPTGVRQRARDMVGEQLLVPEEKVEIFQILQQNGLK